MTVASKFSSAELGLDITLVKVEADVSFGLWKTLIVELGEALVRECKNKVNEGVITRPFEYP